MSVLVGLGAAIIWTAQGAYLTDVSSVNNESRNSGLFWALFQGSMLFGNLFIYFSFSGNSEITNSLRLLVYGTLTVVGLLGSSLMIFLPKALNANENGHEKPSGPMESLMRSVQLIKTKQMAFISVTFFYTGIMQSFILGIYGTSIGNTKTFGSDSSKLVGISGILIGLGEIIGGGLFGILPSITNKYGRDPIVLLGFLSHAVSLGSTYINLPHKSSLEPSDLSAIITPDLPLALVTSFLLGLGDACFSTQIYSFLSTHYKSSSASAFSLFKFTQSVASAVCFLYSNSIDLSLHIPILFLGAVLGTLSFWYVEWNLRQTIDIENCKRQIDDESNSRVERNFSVSQLSHDSGGSSSANSCTPVIHG